jgi:hypothetical protein
MIGALIFLVTVEAGVVHYVLVDYAPTFAWIASLMSLSAIVWLVVRARRAP